jgi:RNA polymerase sigma-70 factor (ECF subfamily)
MGSEGGSGMPGPEGTAPTDASRLDADGASSLFVERLYRSHSAQLIVWLRRKFGEGPPEPEDVAQSAFAKLSGMPSVEHIGNFRAFLFTMASNIAVSSIRTNIRARAFFDQEIQYLEEPVEKITPARVYEAKDALMRTSTAFEKLSERQQDIVIRMRLYGQTYTQIRDEIGWSLGTISAELKTAMKLLAVATDEGSESSDER